MFLQKIFPQFVFVICHNSLAFSPFSLFRALMALLRFLRFVYNNFGPPIRASRHPAGPPATGYPGPIPHTHRLPGGARLGPPPQRDSTEAQWDPKQAQWDPKQAKWDPKQAQWDPKQAQWDPKSAQEQAGPM